MKKNAVIVALLIVVLLFAFYNISAQSSTWQGQKWEYAYTIFGVTEGNNRNNASVYTTDSNEQTALQSAFDAVSAIGALDILNTMGDYGWELVSTDEPQSGPNTFIFYFKRPQG